MKKILLLTSSTYLFLFCYSQNVGIGTATPQNKLHIAGGLRVDTLIGVGGSGLMRHDANGVVYGIKFTGSANDVLRGDGTFGAAAGGAAWLLAGNAGTDPTTNFIGTTDAQPLYFKVNNSLAGHIDLASNNTSFGLGALPIGTSGVTNTAFGFDVLSDNTTGYANTAQGHSSLLSNTTGNQNTAVGYAAMLRNIAGTQNTAVGVAALYSNFTGSNNTAIGFAADVTADGLTNATAIGFSAKVAQSNSIVLGQGANVGIGTSFPNASSLLDLTSNSQGLLVPRMTTIQRNAISSPATGLLVYDNSVNSFYFYNGGSWNQISGGASSNVWSLNGNAGTDPTTNFVGTTDNEPLLFRVNNLTAGQIRPSLANTGFGSEALSSNTTGFQNSAYGDVALFANTTGNYNTAIGVNALKSNTTGNNNTATGAGVLQFNTTGSNNTADGQYALTANTTGMDNTAIGLNALFDNTSGHDNTAIGFDALITNQTGYYNTAVGLAALYEIAGGAFNVGVGPDALGKTTASQYNTAIGYLAGYSSDNGDNNVFVGAGADAGGAGLSNIIAIGQNAICTASDQVTIGNATTNSYQAYADWSNISDGRYKKNLKEDVPGLAFISKLRPVTYNLDATGLDNFLHKNQSKEKQLNGQARSTIERALKEREQTRLTGFVAQEVETSAKELRFNFSGVDAPKSSNEVYGLRYAEFVVPLVKAVQEQQKIIEDQNKKIDTQQQQIDELIKDISALKAKINH